MENIRYGNLNATDQEVMEAARLSNAHSFINRLPKGYDTVISGTKLTNFRKVSVNCFP